MSGGRRVNQGGFSSSGAEGGGAQFVSSYAGGGSSSSSSSSHVHLAPQLLPRLSAAGAASLLPSSLVAAAPPSRLAPPSSRAAGASLGGRSAAVARAPAAFVAAPTAQLVDRVEDARDLVARLRRDAHARSERKRELAAAESELLTAELTFLETLEARKEALVAEERRASKERRHHAAMRKHHEVQARLCAMRGVEYELPAEFRETPAEAAAAAAAAAAAEAAATGRPNHYHDAGALPPLMQHSVRGGDGGALLHRNERLLRLPGAGGPSSSSSSVTAGPFADGESPPSARAAARGGQPFRRGRGDGAEARFGGLGAGVAPPLPTLPEYRPSNIGGDGSRVSADDEGGRERGLGLDEGYAPSPAGVVFHDLGDGETDDTAGTGAPPLRPGARVGALKPGPYRAPVGGRRQLQRHFGNGMYDDESTLAATALAQQAASRPPALLVSTGGAMSPTMSTASLSQARQTAPQPEPSPPVAVPFPSSLTPPSPLLVPSPETRLPGGPGSRLALQGAADFNAFVMMRTSPARAAAAAAAEPLSTEAWLKSQELYTAGGPPTSPSALAARGAAPAGTPRHTTPVISILGSAPQQQSPASRRNVGGAASPKSQSSSPTSAQQSDAQSKSPSLLLPHSSVLRQLRERQLQLSSVAARLNAIEEGATRLASSQLLDERNVSLAEVVGRRETSSAFETGDTGGGVHYLKGSESLPSWPRERRPPGVDAAAVDGGVAGGPSSHSGGLTGAGVVQEATSPPPPVHQTFEGKPPHVISPSIEMPASTPAASLSAVALAPPFAAVGSDEATTGTTHRESGGGSSSPGDGIGVGDAGRGSGGREGGQIFLLSSPGSPSHQQSLSMDAAQQSAAASTATPLAPVAATESATAISPLAAAPLTDSSPVSARESSFFAHVSVTTNSEGHGAQSESAVARATAPKEATEATLSDHLHLSSPTPRFPDSPPPALQHPHPAAVAAASKDEASAPHATHALPAHHGDDGLSVPASMMTSIAGIDDATPLSPLPPNNHFSSTTPPVASGNSPLAHDASSFVLDAALASPHLQSRPPMGGETPATETRPHNMLEDSLAAAPFSPPPNVANLFLEDSLARV